MCIISFGLKLKVLIRFNITQFNFQQSSYISYILFFESILRPDGLNVYYFLEIISIKYCVINILQYKYITI
jgi:hypothetical protein